MVKGKKIRTKGKIQFSRYFQKFKKGERVAVVKEQAVQSVFPLRIQGRTGIIDGEKGRSYYVKVKDGDKEKKFLIEPINLRKIIPLKKNVERE